MDNKCLKKSTMQQLRTLVQYMEENPELARGAPVFGSTKFSSDEKWKKLCNILNALGPPTRTIGEWKKSWADLKSRTKKKLADNQKSLRETGGGLYRYSNLTVLEVIIDRTLLMSSAAAPSGPVFGYETQSIDDCFVALVESPARCSKTIAVVTPTRVETVEKTVPLKSTQKPKITEQPTSATKHHENVLSDSEIEHPASYSAKKRKTADTQMSLIRRQLRIAEGNAITAADQTNAMKRMALAAEVQAEAAKISADAAKMQAEAAKRSADAAEVQAEAAKRSAAANELIAANIKEALANTIGIRNILENYLTKN